MFVLFCCLLMSDLDFLMNLYPKPCRAFYSILFYFTCVLLCMLCYVMLCLLYLDWNTIIDE